MAYMTSYISYYKNRTSVHQTMENEKTIQYIMTRCRKQSELKSSNTRSGIRLLIKL